MMQAFHIPHNDLFQLGGPFSKGQGLVQLFLVFSKVKPGSGILDDVLALSGRIGFRSQVLLC